MCTCRIHIVEAPGAEIMEGILGLLPHGFSGAGVAGQDTGPAWMGSGKHPVVMGGCSAEGRSKPSRKSMEMNRIVYLSVFDKC
jgi:hypothetical protein